MENGIVEVTPASPPPTSEEADLQPQSPEIRVTDSPVSEASTSRGNTPPLSSPPSLSAQRPPLIFQPFLPLPGAVHRALPFSIDNILKPNFGPRSILSNPAFFSTLALANHAAATAAQNSVVASAVSQHQQQKTVHNSIPDRQRSPSSSSSSNGSLVKSELKSPPSSPLNHNNNQPVDLSSKNSVNENNKKGSGSPDGKTQEDGVPPGMVRGPNGQLWPAWVFCTRYSDRPSSGKHFNFNFHFFS